MIKKNTNSTTGIPPLKVCNVGLNVALKVSIWFQGASYYANEILEKWRHVEIEREIKKFVFTTGSPPLEGCKMGLNVALNYMQQNFRTALTCWDSER